MRNLRVFPERLTRAGRRGLDHALGRARELANRTPPPAAVNVVEFNRLDRVILDGRRSKWPRYDSLVRRGSERVPHFENLMEDLFYGLYLHEPNLRLRGSMLPTHRLNHDLFMQAQRLAIWEQARSNAVLNPNHAMIGLVYVAQELLQAMDDTAKEAAQQAEESQAEAERRQEDADRELDDLMRQLADALAGEDGDADQPQPAAGNLIAQMMAGKGRADAGGAAEAEPTEEERQAIASIAAALDEIERDLDGDEPPDPFADLDPAKARVAARKGVQQASDALDSLDHMLSAWGSDAAEFNALDPAQAFELYERINDLPQIEQFTIELGRMRNAGLEAQMQSNAREPQEIVDITTGRSWSEVLPSERMLLADERTAPLFWARMMQEGLLTWAYAGREAANRGPFILLVDVSGSTHGARERWGKAFTLAALDMARREHRACGVIFFDTVVHENGMWSFPDGRVGLMDKIGIASFWTGGGTNWESPLLQALANIEATDGTWQRADIVMITDGECAVSPEFAADYRRRCEAKGIRTHGVLLDMDDRHRHALEPFCDRAFTVSSLAGTESAKPIFDSLAS